MKYRKIFAAALKYPLDIQAFALLLIVNLAFSYYGFYLVTNPVDISSLLSLGTSLTPFVAANVIVTIFLMALYIDNATQYFSGRRKSLLSSVATAKKKFFRLLGTELLVMAVTILASLPFALAAVPSLSVIAILGLAAGTVAVVLVSFFLSLAPYIAVLDKSGVIGSLKASIKIINKNKPRVFLFWAIYLSSAILLGLAAVALQLVALLGSGEALFLHSLITTYTALFTYSAFSNLYRSVKK